MFTLSFDSLLSIAKLVGFHDLCALSHTCRTWREITNHASLYHNIPVDNVLIKEYLKNVGLEGSHSTAQIRALQSCGSVKVLKKYLMTIPLLHKLFYAFVNDPVSIDVFAYILAVSNPNCVDSNKRTVLHLAAHHRPTPEVILNMLLERKVQINLRDRYDNGAITYLARKPLERTARCLSLLVLKGAQITHRNHETVSPLADALQSDGLGALVLPNECRVEALINSFAFRKRRQIFLRTLPQELKILLHCSFFQGCLTDNEATKLLTNYPVGSYICYVPDVNKNGDDEWIICFLANTPDGIWKRVLYYSTTWQMIKDAHNKAIYDTLQQMTPKFSQYLTKPLAWYDIPKE